MNASTNNTTEEVLPTCSNPGCDQPGTKQCSACKITPYCGPICQTAHWTHHKEEWPGHLRKVGMTHLEKAQGFYQQRNWVRTLRYADLALTKLKQLKDRRLETVEIIDAAFSNKFDSLQFMDRHSEALECAKEKYTLWAMNHIRNPRMLEAAFGLIQSCIHNKEFDDASLYAHTAHESVLFPQTDERSCLHRDVTGFPWPHYDWQRLEASHRKKSRMRERERLHSDARRWRSALNCMGPRMVVPMCWTTSTTLTTTRFFVFMLKRTRSLVDWKERCLRTWPQGSTTWATCITKEQSEQRLTMTWTDALPILS